MRLVPLISLLLLWICFSLPALAQDASLYEGEVAVADQSAAERAAALPRALAQVLVKVTGDAAAGRHPALQGALARAGEMMQQYRYRQDVSTAGAAPVVRLFVLARFDSDAVDALIGRAGLPTWPSPRPRPLLWLAIDDGRGARLLGESQAGAVAALTRRASERGLGLSFPKADLADQTVGGAQAVWREDFESVRTAATRYGRRAPLLVGRMERSGGGWSAQWRLLEQGRELHRWSAVDAEAATVLAAGADGTADALSRSYAQLIMGGEAGDYDVVVVGLDQARDYARVLAYLQQLPIVQAVQVREANGDALRVGLSLRTGVEGLTRLVESGNLLRAEAGSGAPDEPPRFRLER